MHSTRVSRRIDAPRPRVYRALLDPAAVAQWRVPAGMSSHVHEFDAREGGTFRISLTYDAADQAGKSAPHTDNYHGYFSQLVTDERVVELLEFETSEPTLRGTMTVTTTLTDAEGGGTDVSIEHERLPEGVSSSDNEIGSRMALAALAELVEAPHRGSTAPALACP